MINYILFDAVNKKVRLREAPTVLQALRDIVPELYTPSSAELLLTKINEDPDTYAGGVAYQQIVSGRYLYLIKGDCIALHVSSHLKNCAITKNRVLGLFNFSPEVGSVAVFGKDSGNSLVSLNQLQEKEILNLYTKRDIRFSVGDDAQ